MHEQPRSRRALVTAAAVVLAFAAFTLNASAHHGWGGYQDGQFEISGTVETPVSLAGPHATLRIRSEGQVWDVVLAPSTRTARAGLKEGMIPVGARVTASGHRHRDAKKFEIKTERLTWNGRTFNVYPDRNAS